MNAHFEMAEKVASSTLSQHYLKEEEVKKQLLKLEDEFREMYAMTQNEMASQLVSTEEMWAISQRYNVLVTCPELCVVPGEDSLLAEFHEKLKLLRSSNCRILSALHVLRKSCRIFENLCAQLDMKMETPLILGDTFHRPISYFMELITDLFKYMHAGALKRKCWASLFDPKDPSGLMDYQRLLEHSEEFEEYLTVGLTYCKCLRPKPSCEH